ncbi:heme ABC exporter ATP-binding protein CcmA [Psychrobacter sp. I-STPA10]|uniref:heme ABC exporter ATP-binding protein CcmA n=1 Tax=Psychrobacter sp. I-STPA10 TaxID=2585769 RepID=UPI001E4958D8|nr:heme ABC exporter ATP-binding protein CcmA [Psychrobacter sp. I-STPA10]
MNSSVVGVASLEQDTVNSHTVSTMPVILSLSDVTVQRGDFTLCMGVDLSLQAGQICHLVGANGAGKTTLLMQLAGLLPILQGQVHYLGQDSLPIQPIYVTHQLGIHPHLSVAQNLNFLLNLYGIKATTAQLAAALEWVGLSGFESMSSGQLSAGQTRRVTLARLYLMQVQHTPLWLLDEPFTALDVAMVAQLEQRLQEFVQSGGAVLMTSHQRVSIATQCLDLSDYLYDVDLDDSDINL